MEILWNQRRRDSEIIWQFRRNRGKRAGFSAADIQRQLDARNGRGRMGEPHVDFKIPRLGPLLILDGRGIELDRCFDGRCSGRRGGRTLLNDAAEADDSLRGKLLAA